MHKCNFYVGGYNNGKKSGKGKCYDQTGKLIYKGGFEYDFPTDRYPMALSSTCRFEGKKYSDGKYIGETENGQRHGCVFFVFLGGNIWYGEWRNDRQIDGIYLNMDGSIKTGK